MTELATITEYGPPFWDDRAWNTSNVPQGERRLFRALMSTDAEKVLTALGRFSKGDLAEPYGKTRAFALDFVVSMETWRSVADVFMFDSPLPEPAEFPRIEALMGE